ncbi:MAG: DUF424 family protein [Candidatus Marsarchaeota archaeon]|nr:DUF424 family protein [Candidatus Marsarchaeota archaeon]
MIYIKVHDSQNGTLIAMCDSDMINKVLKEGEVVIDIKSYGSFYSGKLVDSREAAKIVRGTKNVFSANIIGKESIGVAIDTGLVRMVNVLHVDGVPYAHSYKIA